MVVATRLLERGREGVIQNLYVSYIAANQPQKMGRVVNGGKVERWNGRKVRWKGGNWKLEATCAVEEKKKSKGEERKGKEREKGEKYFVSGWVSPIVIERVRGESKRGLPALTCIDGSGHAFGMT